MNSKLTLKLDTEVIKDAKKYASQQGASLSKLVENYFKALALAQQEELPSHLTPVVKELSGVIPANDYEDEKDAYTDYLRKKYE